MIGFELLLEYDLGAFFAIGILMYVVAIILAILFDSKPNYSNILSNIVSCFASLLMIYVSMIVALTGKHLKLGPYEIIIPQAPLIIDVDSISAVLIFAISSLTFAISIFSIGYLKMFYHKRSMGYFGLFYNLFVMAMILTCCVSNTLWFLQLWELMTASSYFLVVYEDTPDIRKIGYFYFIMMHLGFACLIVSLSLMSFAVGSMDFNIIEIASVNISGELKTIILILALIGFGMKIGLFPLYVWLPEAYPEAPSNVSALLSGVMASVGLYGLIKISILLHATMSWWYITLSILAIINVLVGFLSLLGQIDFKRLLAYSSMIEMGLAVLSLAYYCAGSEMGLKASLMHVINQAYAKGMLFAISGVFLYCAYTKKLSDIKGLWKSNSFLATLYFIALVDIMGIPPFGCFFSKVFIILSGFSQFLSWWGPVSATIALILEILCFIWFLRILQYALMGNPSQVMLEIKRPPLSMYIGLIILAILCAISGILSMYFVGGI